MQYRLVGRALFVCFLADRAMLGSGVLPKGMPDTSILFDDAKSIIAISRCLDDTFNGDFLPLSPFVVRGLSKLASYDWVTSSGAPDGQLQLGREEKWDRLDFAHIPVGVLSQACERYFSKRAPEPLPSLRFREIMVPMPAPKGNTSARVAPPLHLLHRFGEDDRSRFWTRQSECQPSRWVNWIYLDVGRSAFLGFSPLPR